MEKLRQILKERKFSIKDDALETKIREYGYDPAKLSDQDAQVVADELTKEKGALTKSAEGIAVQSPKPQNGNGKAPAGTNVEGLQRSMLEAWDKQQANLKAFTGRLQTNKQTVITNWVEENYQIINTTSQDAVDALTRKLVEVESDPETFLGVADRISEVYGAVGQ